MSAVNSSRRPGPRAARSGWLGSLGAALAIMLAACCLPASAQNAGGQARAVNTIIEHDTELLTFLCGGELTGEEKRRFAAQIIQQVPKDPNLWYRNDVAVSQDLKSLHGNVGAIPAEIWLKWRWSYALDTVEGSRILAAHDPIVVLNREHGLLITEHTLRTLQAAATWLARETGRPAPGEQYAVTLRKTIQQQWHTWPDDTLHALTNSVKDFPATVEYTLGVMPEAKRKELFAAWAGDLGSEPRGTLQSATRMAGMYRALVQVAFRQTVQVLKNEASMWSINRSNQKMFCEAIYAGHFTSGFGAGCGPN